MRNTIVLLVLLACLVGCRTANPDVVIPNVVVTDDCTEKPELWWGQKGQVPAEVWKCYDWVIKSMSLENR